MRSYFLVLCSGVFAVPAFVAADARDPYPVAAIGSAEDRLAQAEARRDAAAIREVLADDVTLFPLGEAPVTGKEDAARWLARRPSDSVSHERLKASAIDVCGEYAIETGGVLPEAPGAGAMTPPEMRYLSIWRREADGSWKLGKTMWTRSSAARAGEPGASSVLPPQTRAPAGLPLPVAAPPSDFIPIPDPRPLSDGFVRNIGDQIRARAAKIRSLEAANASAEVREAAIRRADRELQVLIRDVGWIDVYRFGVPTACNAAFIVERSGDPALIKSAVPLMKDLQSNEESAACYRSAREAYERLPK